MHPPTPARAFRSLSARAHHMRRQLAALGCVAALLALPGCGGGGGDPTLVAPATTGVALESAQFLAAGVAPSVAGLVPASGGGSSLPAFTCLRQMARLGWAETPAGQVADFSTPRFAGRVDPMLGSIDQLSSSEVYPIDLDGDGLQEVVVGGFMSLPFTIARHRHSRLLIFGWNAQGALVDQTAQWLGGVSNTYIGAGNVNFGDFNGDGRIDIFIPPSTDMAYFGNAVAFISQAPGGFARVEVPFDDLWAHDAVVYDLDADGLDDVFVAAYGSDVHFLLGRADGGFDKRSGELIPMPTPAPSYVSAVSVGDFLGDGSATLVVADVGDRADPRDTRLLRWTLEGSRILFEQIAALPLPRFELPEWSSYNFDDDLPFTNNSHDIRVLATDFNADGRLDALVFSRPSAGIGLYPLMGAIQFLRNDGAGQFVDVTDTQLSGYDHFAAVTYNPTMIDINRDGLMDIFAASGANTFEGDKFDTNQLLIRRPEGGYRVEKQPFADFSRQVMKSLQPGTITMPMNLVQGPCGFRYMVGFAHHDVAGDKQFSVYVSAINGSSMFRD